MGEKRTLKLAARFADMTHWFGGSIENLKRLNGVLEGHCEAEGRDPATIFRTIGAPVLLVVDAVAGLRAGDAELADLLRRFRSVETNTRILVGAGEENAGAVDIGENPADTLVRELHEEWSVTPERVRGEALLRLPHQLVMFVGQAWLAEGAEVVPDDEHDEFAWWPSEVGRWPAEADENLRRMARWLSA